jgi:hypothetical protein
MFILISHDLTFPLCSILVYVGIGCYRLVGANLDSDHSAALIRKPGIVVISEIRVKSICRSKLLSTEISELALPFSSHYDFLYAIGPKNQCR